MLMKIVEKIGFKLEGKCNDNQSVSEIDKENTL